MRLTVQFTTSFVMTYMQFMCSCLIVYANKTIQFSVQLINNMNVLHMSIKLNIITITTTTKKDLHWKSISRRNNYFKCTHLKVYLGV